MRLEGIRAGSDRAIRRSPEVATNPGTAPLSKHFMALDTDGTGRTGKRPVDAMINMVPFIDLLVCCIAFLIITAVWTQLERLDVRQKDGPPRPNSEPADPPPTLLVRLGEAGFAIQDDAGVRLTVPKTDGHHDVATLARELARLRPIEPDKTRVVVAPDDGEHYDDVVATMDAVLAARFGDLGVTATP